MNHADCNLSQNILRSCGRLIVLVSKESRGANVKIIFVFFLSFRRVFLSDSKERRESVPSTSQRGSSVVVVVSLSKRERGSLNVSMQLGRREREREREREKRTRRDVERKREWSRRGSASTRMTFRRKEADSFPHPPPPSSLVRGEEEGWRERRGGLRDWRERGTFGRRPTRCTGNFLLSLFLIDPLLLSLLFFFLSLNLSLSLTVGESYSQETRARGRNSRKWRVEVVSNDEAGNEIFAANVFSSASLSGEKYTIGLLSVMSIAIVSIPRNPGYSIE